MTEPVVRVFRPPDIPRERRNPGRLPKALTVPGFSEATIGPLPEEINTYRQIFPAV